MTTQQFIQASAFRLSTGAAMSTLNKPRLLMSSRRFWSKFAAIDVSEIPSLTLQKNNRSCLPQDTKIRRDHLRCQHRYSSSFASFSCFLSQHCGHHDLDHNKQLKIMPFSSAVLSSDGDDNDDPSTSSDIPYLLADIGEGIAEVELLQWFVSEGDVVSQFDKICEVQSDKATVEITSRYDGEVTRLQGHVGDMIKVGTPILYIKGDNQVSSDSTSLEIQQEEEIKNSRHEEEQLHIPKVASKFHLKSDDIGVLLGQNEDPDAETSESSMSATSAPANNLTNEPVLTTPAIRKLAKEYQLDLRTIVGTGPKGRVLKGDVLSLLETSGRLTQRTPSTSAVDSSLSQPLHQQVSSSSPTPTTKRDTIVATKLADVDLPLEHDVSVPLRGYQRLMAQTMTASLEIPHMVYCDEIDMTRVKSLKKDIGVSILPFCIKAASLALQQYPQVNATFDSKSEILTYHAAHNIGIAMDTPRGLIVPVIFNVNNKTMEEITHDLQRFKTIVVERDCKFESSDLQGATFTLSNVGALGSGGTVMGPVVTPPMVAIGAMGKMQRLPRFASSDSMDVIEAHIMHMSWAGDHRILDGATLARFHTSWKRYLEQPLTLLEKLK